MLRGSRGARLFAHELGHLLVLALPMVVNQLGQIGMTTADTIMVGPLGALALAAAGLSGAIHHFGLTIASGTVMGLGPQMSQAFGAGNLEHCRRVLVQGWWVALLTSIPVILLTMFGEAVALFLGQDAEVAALAGRFLRALVPGIPAVLLFTAARQYLEATGHAKAPMMVTFVGLAMNIVLNRVFIYGVGDVIPAMGLVGSGYATTISRWTMAGIVIVFLATHPTQRSARRLPFRPDRALILRTLSIGAPIGASFGLEIGLFALAAVMMGWLGSIELAAHQVTINIAATTFMVALGTSQAGAIRVGQRIGAGRPRAMRRAVLATYIVSTGFMLTCALIFLLFPRQLIGLYTSDAAILDLGVKLLLVAAAFQIFDGAQVAGISVLRGAADTRMPMILAAIGYWCVGLPIAYLLGFRFDYGPVGVWIGLSFGLGGVAILLIHRARRILWSRSPAARYA
jgi:multidrug resistance protein, MATE family